VELCDCIERERIPYDGPIYYPLVTAINNLYARPFKHGKGMESLTDQFVPKKFHHLHKQLITLRDETFWTPLCAPLPLFDCECAFQNNSICRENCLVHLPPSDNGLPTFSVAMRFASGTSAERCATYSKSWKTDTG
jgi:hypothetical protein